MPPGISSTLSSRKTSGEGRRQPLVYSIHGCSRTMAAIPRSHWIPPAWLPSSSAAGTSTTCTPSPASRVSWWAGWPPARNASAPGVPHCQSWGRARGARRHKADLSVHSPVSSVCISRGFHHRKVQIIVDVAAPAQFLGMKAKWGEQQQVPAASPGLAPLGTCTFAASTTKNRLQEANTNWKQEPKLQLP